MAICCGPFYALGFRFHQSRTAATSSVPQSKSVPVVAAEAGERTDSALRVAQLSVNRTVTCTVVDTEPGSSCVTAEGVLAARAARPWAA